MTLLNSVLEGNSAQLSGAAAYLQQSIMDMHTCVVANNTVRQLQISNWIRQLQIM